MCLLWQLLICAPLGDFSPANCCWGTHPITAEPPGDQTSLLGRLMSSIPPDGPSSLGDAVRAPPATPEPALPAAHSWGSSWGFSTAPIPNLPLIRLQPWQCCVPQVPAWGYSALHPIERFLVLLSHLELLSAAVSLFSPRVFVDFLQRIWPDGLRQEFLTLRSFFLY